MSQKEKRHAFHQEHITVHLAVGAAGVNVPLIISYPRSPPSVAYAMDGLRNRMRGDTDKGYMTTELFMIWPQGVIEHASKHLCPINGPAKNALWGHVIDICRAKETEILLLPQTVITCFSCWA